MLKEIIARGMFYWLRAPRLYADVRNDEYVLANARLLLSTCIMGAIISFERYAPLAGHIRLVFMYLVYSLAVIAAYRVYANWSPIVHVAVHCADILWAACLMIWLSEPAIFVALSAFVLAAAALRWGFIETTATTFLIAVCLFVVHLFDELPLIPEHLRGLQIIPLVILGLAVAFTLGLLAEGKAHRGEVYSINQIIQKVRLQAGFETAIRHINLAGSRLFGAQRGVVVTQNGVTGDNWILVDVHSENPVKSREDRHVSPEQYFFPAPAPGLRLVRSRSKAGFKCHILRDGKISLDKTGFSVPEAFRKEHPFRRLLAYSLDLENEVRIRIFIVNPLRFFGGCAALRFLEKGARLSAPILSDLLLMERQQAEVEAATGSRIARDLHDGVIQSLTAINLQMEELRKQTSSILPQSEDPLTYIQQNIQREIQGLRDLSQHLRSYDIDSGNFLGFLSGMAVKFQLEHGIATRFMSEVDSVALQPKVCGELARMVMEALVNVKKHSRASEVFVRLQDRDGETVISVLDNGRGFGFTGHRSHDELLASGTGPAVIMERARKIHAKVSVESVEGSGACLEISLPG